MGRSSTAPGLAQGRQSKGLRVGAGWVCHSLSSCHLCPHCAGCSHGHSPTSPCGHCELGTVLLPHFVEQEVEVLVPQLVRDQSRVKRVVRVTAVTGASVGHTACLATHCTL